MQARREKNFFITNHHNNITPLIIRDFSLSIVGCIKAAPCGRSIAHRSVVLQVIDLLFLVLPFGPQKRLAALARFSSVWIGCFLCLRQPRLISSRFSRTLSQPAFLAARQPQHQFVHDTSRLRSWRICALCKLLDRYHGSRRSRLCQGGVVRHR